MRNLKRIIKNIFSDDSKYQNQDTVVLRKKWMNNGLVKEWQKKGWLTDEESILDYLVKEWERIGAPVPPPHKVKANAIEAYCKKFKYDTLIETGTFKGKMIDAQKNNFSKIISIEVDKQFHEDAVLKFKKYPHIQCYLGDSGKLLADIVSRIDTAAIFWLDAHYNHSSTAKLDKECPIYEELDAIFRSKKLDHILLIDDARLFVGKNDYPTIADLSKYILLKRPDYHITIKDDIICVVKK